MWRQRSQVLWLLEGDRNTRYFHNKASQLKKTNHFTKIQNNARVWLSGEARDQVITNYFSQLFTSSNAGNDWAFLDQMNGRITEEMVRMLEADFTREEVNCAIKQMLPYKAPGPDGVAPLFF